LSESRSERATNFHLLTVGHRENVSVFFSTVLHLTNRAKIDDAGSMYANETHRIEFAIKVRDGSAKKIRLTLSYDADVISFRLKILNVIDGNEYDSAFVLYHDAIEVAYAGNAVQ